jgi:hypothetical protein
MHDVFDPKSQFKMVLSEGDRVVKQKSRLFAEGGLVYVKRKIDLNHKKTVFKLWIHNSKAFNIMLGIEYQSTAKKFWYINLEKGYKFSN